MSASVLPMRRPTFLAHPEGAPVGLRTDPVRLSSFAVMLADLCGEDVDSLYPERLDVYRQHILLAAWLAHPHSRDLVARHVLAETQPDLRDAAPVVRATEIGRLLRGLSRALRAVHGTGRQADHHAMVTQQVHDDAAASLCGEAV